MFLLHYLVSPPGLPSLMAKCTPHMEQGKYATGEKRTESHNKALPLPFSKWCLNFRKVIYSGAISPVADQHKEW
jgi:hypothetical protein